MEHEQQKFSARILEMARFIGKVQAVAYADSTPAEIHNQLKSIEKALTVALQVLLPLDLCHSEDQDLESDPYNWPVTMELSSGRSQMEFIKNKGYSPLRLEPATYPTELIAELLVLRDAARFAANQVKPGPGNSSRRSPRSNNIEIIGKNFVFRYRSTFKEMPPITRTGWVVDLLSQALAVAGIEGADAAEVLRRSIERDVTGRTHLPSAAVAKGRQRRLKGSI